MILKVFPLHRVLSGLLLGLIGALAMPAMAQTTAAPKAAGSATAAGAPVAATVIKPSQQTVPKVTNAAELCKELVARLPDVTSPQCSALSLQMSTGKSVRGIPIFQQDVAAPVRAGANAVPRRRVLVIGGIHGDELSSSALVLNWIREAQETSGNIEWRFVPLVNPDAMLMPKPTRTNANGVDLNRNFPTPHWDEEAPKYWQARTNRDPRRYPGEKALSEPESRWLHDEMDRFKPHLIVSIHAPYGVLDFDGPSVPPQRLGRLYLDQVGIYPGSLGNYGGVHKRVPVVTIELANARRTPTAVEMRQMWLDMMRWMSERIPE